jgi:hypothetical protein
MVPLEAFPKLSGRELLVQKIRLSFFAVILALAAFSSHAARAATDPVIDWSKGDVQAIDANCGGFTFTHMRDHGSYSLWVRGTVLGTCTFHADGVTFLYPPNHGPTTHGTRTLYAFLRVGNEVVVTWQPGY